MSTLKLNNDYHMPLLGLGTWKGDNAEEVVVTAIETGYRHIDGSPIYLNEIGVGKGIKKAIEENKIVKRQDLFIVSKLWCHKHRREDVKPALKQTLKNLQLDFLDLYLMHFPLAFKSGDDPFPVDEEGDVIYDDIPHMETWEAMEECVREGLVRSIGLSNFNSQQILNVLTNCSIKPAVLQVEIYPYFQNQKLVDFCHAHDIAVTGYSNFGSPTREWKDDAPIDSVFEDKMINKLARKHNKTPAQIILRWLVQRNIVAIPKSSNPVRIKENLQIFDFNLTNEDLRELSSLDREKRMFGLDMAVNGTKLIRNRNVPHYPFDAEF